jgi:CRISPR-associated endonuclease/helicase Cas3
MKYIAHVRRLDNGEWDEPQSLEDHLRGTAELAASFAEDFNSSEWGYVLGMAHDIKKGTEVWLSYLCNKSGYYDEEASSETMPGKCEHSGPSAKLAEELFGKFAGRFLSYCIAGHHTGLPDWTGTQSSLQFRLEHADTSGISEELKKILSPLCPKDPPWTFDSEGIDVSLWIRMLFSCLVDADRLNTEKYMVPKKHTERQGYCSIAELHQRFTLYMGGKIQQASVDGNSDVYRVRQQVLADCKKAAYKEPGFFSLTVPTGGGKTLSSMAFALAHAEEYGKNRIIYVIPTISIIEQNAEVFREAFGPNEILEHHSSLDPDETTERMRLAIENWDAPIIVTTSVQFYESLFAAKTGKCRKLHNIANSVVILDEAQLVPIDFLEPILAAMQLLTKHYKVSFVFCTATQPVFEKQEAFPDFPGLQGPVREIISDVQGIYKELERTKIELPNDTVPIQWQELAKELSGYDQVLCIVSDRKSCRELHAQMPKGTYHLSALMCPEHRSDIIAKIKRALQEQESVRVISTQLVEAGVDIDFPVVYRAMAGFDSIAQAAGRCNREGKLNEKGKVVVFNGPRKAPPGVLRKAAETAWGICKQNVKISFDTALFNCYFSELYWKANTWDKKDIMGLLKPDFPYIGIQFREASSLFRVIDDKNQCTILVPYKEGEHLINLLKNSKIPEKKMLRKLQRYTINIYRNQFSELQRRGSIEEIIPGIFALNNKVEYSEEIGLLIEEMPNDPEDFMDI